MISKVIGAIWRWIDRVAPRRKRRRRSSRVGVAYGRITIHVGPVADLLRDCARAGMTAQEIADVVREHVREHVRNADWEPGPIGFASGGYVDPGRLYMVGDDNAGET